MSNPAENLGLQVLALLCLAALAAAYLPVLVGVIVFLVILGVAVTGLVELMFWLAGDEEDADG